MGTQLALTGPMMAVYVNSNIFGITNSFSYSLDYAVSSTPGIDIMGPIEVTPESFKISGAIKIFRLVGDGGPEGYGLFPSLDQLSLGKYLSLVILDRTNGTPIFSSDTIIFKSQKWELKSRTVVRWCS